MRLSSLLMRRRRVLEVARKGRSLARPTKQMKRKPGESDGREATVGVLARAASAGEREDTHRSQDPPAAAPRTKPGLLQEPLVVPHHHLRLDLLHRVERHADHDQ